MAYKELQQMLEQEVEERKSSVKTMASRLDLIEASLKRIQQTSSDRTVKECKDMPPTDHQESLKTSEWLADHDLPRQLSALEDRLGAMRSVMHGTCDGRELTAHRLDVDDMYGIRESVYDATLFVFLPCVGISVSIV